MLYRLFDDAAEEKAAWSPSAGVKEAW